MRGFGRPPSQLVRAPKGALHNGDSCLRLIVPSKQEGFLGFGCELHRGLALFRSPLQGTTLRSTHILQGRCRV